MLILNFFLFPLKFGCAKISAHTVIVTYCYQSNHRRHMCSLNPLVLVQNGVQFFSLLFAIGGWFVIYVTRIFPKAFIHLSVYHFYTLTSRNVLRGQPCDNNPWVIDNNFVYYPNPCYLRKVMAWTQFLLCMHCDGPQRHAFELRSWSKGHGQ